MSRFWSELVGELTPYVPGEQPKLGKLVKLNTNEHPYPPSPAVLKAIASVSPDELRGYPDPESSELRQAFAARHGLAPDQVFLGNGSDEVLAHVFQALLKHEQPLLFPDITYSFYPVWCDLYKINWREVPLTPEFLVDPTAYRGSNGGIIIPNPNAPTGILLGLDGIRTVLEQNPDSVVVIDEAYIDFGGESAVCLVPDFDNLLVVQTMSKSWALAGLRVGVAMGNETLIDGLQRVKNSFNSYPLDTVAQRAGVAALGDNAYFKEACEKVVASREQLSEAMSKLGFDVLPSAANFILARHPVRPARELFAALRSRGIIVRHFERPRIEEYLRISIGTPQQCKELLAALAEVLD